MSLWGAGEWAPRTMTEAQNATPGQPSLFGSLVRANGGQVPGYYGNGGGSAGGGGANYVSRSGNGGTGGMWGANGHEIGDSGQ